MALQPLPPQVSERTVPALLEATARARGTHIALIAPGLDAAESRVTYSQLATLSAALAGRLQRAGVGPGDRVAILLDQSQSVESHVAYHSSHRIGAVNVPVNTRYVERELGVAIELTRPSAVVFSPRFGPMLKGLADRLGEALLIEASTEPETGESLERAFAEAPTTPVPVDEGDDADWIFTSGTTGTAKAVALTHGGSVACAHQSRHLWGLEPESVYQSFAPFFTSTGSHTNLLPCLLTGCTYVIEPEFDVAGTLERIVRNRTTSVFLVSGVIQLMLDRLDAAELDAAVEASALRRIAYGGHPMATHFYRRVEEVFGQRHGLELVHLWGLTEGGTCGTLLPPELHRTAVGRADKHGLSIGNRGFSDWISFEVKRPDMVRAQPREVGEICVRSPSVMDRYVDEPEATREALRGGWLHTGDMGSVDEDGYLYFVDRRKQMIRRGGLNISSAEVEGVIAQHPAVSEVAAVPRPNPILEQEVKAVVVLRDGAEASEEEIIDHCRGLLADYKVPVEVAFRDELPKNAMGRVVKAALADEQPAVQG